MKCPDDSKIPTKTTVKSNLEYIYGKNRYFLHKNNQITRIKGCMNKKKRFVPISALEISAQSFGLDNETLICKYR